MVQYLLLFLTMPADFTLSGYIDVASREFPSVVTAAATDGERLAIATFESGKTQITLYDSRLQRLSQLTAPQFSTPRVIYLLAIAGEDVLTAERIAGQMNLCRYKANVPEGSLKVTHPCFAAPDDPMALGFEKGIPAAIGGSWYLRWEQGAWQQIPLPWPGGEGPVLASIGDAGAIRLSSTTSQLEILRGGREVAHTGAISSPDSSQRAESRARNQMLWARVFWAGNNEIWIQRGSWHVTTGFAFDRFTTEGRYQGTHFVPMPRYPELIQKAETGPRNTTGYLAPNAVLPIGEGLAIVDFQGKRSVQFAVSLPGGRP